MKKFSSIITVIVAFLAGCRGSEESTTGYDIMVKDSKESISSALAPIERIDTINLACPDSVILGSIKQVYVADSMFVVVDNMSAAYGFDADGSYICAYGRQGEAPSEYVNMSACAVTPEGNDVVIVDSYTHRMLYFDIYNGEYKQSVELPIGSLDMAQQCVFLTDSTALLARYVYNDKNAVYAYINLADMSVENFASVDMKTEKVGTPVGWHAISTYQGEGAYVKPFDPVIYQYPDTRWIFIDQDKKVYSNQELTEITNFSLPTVFEAADKGYFTGYSDIFVLKDWIFLAYQNVDFSLINKRNYEMKTYKYEMDDIMNYINVANIIGAVAGSNSLIGANNGPMSEDDCFFIYHLSH